MKLVPPLSESEPQVEIFLDYGEIVTLLTVRRTLSNGQSFTQNLARIVVEGDKLVMQKLIINEHAANAIGISMTSERTIASSL